jgi:hypothetical protein
VIARLDYGFTARHYGFTIRFDEQSKAYYTIASRIKSPEQKHARNLLSLMRSRDLVEWEVVCDLLNFEGHDPKKIGFQYVDFFFEGEDILFLCRTAINSAHNYHDANYSTFHRIKSFRSISK